MNFINYEVLSTVDMRKDAPDVREKLVKLVEYMDGVCPSGVSCYNCPHKDIGEGCSIQAKVDYLIKGGVTVQEWISVKDRLPESGKHVLLLCEVHSYGGGVHGKYVCDGYYAEPKTITGGCGDDCATEYDEEDDEYYLLGGWYEVIKNWDDYNSIVIGDFVTHWMPLPQPPKEVKQ